MARKRKPEEAKARSGMHLGALALLDALGFKGIWRKYPPIDVLKRMEIVKQEASRFPKHFGSKPTQARVRTRILFVSDSIFLAAWAGPRSKATKWDCLFAVEAMALLLTWKALEGDGCVFRYRGVIGFGEFALSGSSNFIVGEAVDEVAMLEREAEGAFIWAAPSCRYQEEEPAGSMMIKWDVPLKGGAKYRTYVLNPIFSCARGEALDIQLSLLGHREGRIDIDMKRQNVYDFLAEARRRNDEDGGWKDEPPAPLKLGLGTPNPYGGAALGATGLTPKRLPQYLGHRPDEDEE
jgi:hypothetical protein